MVVSVVVVVVVSFDGVDDDEARRWCGDAVLDDDDVHVRFIHGDEE